MKDNQRLLQKELQEPCAKDKVHSEIYKRVVGYKMYKKFVEQNYYFHPVGGIPFLFKITSKSTLDDISDGTQLW